MNKRQIKKQAKKVGMIRDTKKPLREGKELGAMKSEPESPEPQIAPPPQDRE